MTTGDPHLSHALAASDDALATPGEIAAHLREDPVLVQQAVGNGHTEAAVAALRERVEDAGFPVYVALVRPPAGLERFDALDDLITVLHSRIGRPGLYVVGDERGAVRWEPYDVPVESLDIYAGLESAHGRLPVDEYGSSAVAGTGEAALVIDIAADPDHQLSAARVAAVRDDPALMEAQYPEWEPYHPGYLGWVVALAVLLATVAALTTRTAVSLRGRSGAPASTARNRRGTRGGGQEVGGRQPADLDRLRSEARRLVAEVDRRRGRRRVAPEAAELAGRCVDLAADLAGRPDPVDVVGAVVLARTGRAAVAGDPAYRPCFFNPLHGVATTRTRFPQAGVVAPSCGDCRRDADAGRRQDALLVDTWRGRRPYWTRESVWARTGFGSLADDLAAEVAADPARPGSRGGRR